MEWLHISTIWSSALQVQNIQQSTTSADTEAENQSDVLIRETSQLNKLVSWLIQGTNFVKTANCFGSI